MIALLIIARLSTYPIIDMYNNTDNFAHYFILDASIIIFERRCLTACLFLDTQINFEIHLRYQGTDHGLPSELDFFFANHFLPNFLPVRAFE